jgi:DNA-binding transcriptional regulator LsrR (DeoR family)
MPRKPRINERDEPVYMVAAAKLRSDGIEQKEIAAALHLPEPGGQQIVSALLSRAKDKGWLSDPRPIFREAKVKEDDPDLWAQAEERFLSSGDLNGQLSKLAPNDHHCEAHIIENDKEPHFSVRAADRVNELLLQRGGTVGIMWGVTVASIVRAIESARFPMKSKGRSLEFVPLCGEPPRLENLENLPRSASSLAARLAQAVNGKPSPGESLSLVPAYISPRNYARDEILRFIADIPGYQAIIGKRTKKQPLARIVTKLDAVLTGIGVIDDEGPQRESRIATFLLERIKQGDAANEDELKSIAFGDIGGWLIAKSPEHEERVSQLNQGLTGFQEVDLKAVAKKGKPGVVIIANEPPQAKSRFIRELVKRGLCNHLIVSRRLANAILALSHRE